MLHLISILNQLLGLWSVEGREGVILPWGFCLNVFSLLSRVVTGFARMLMLFISWFNVGSLCDLM